MEQINLDKHRQKKLLKIEDAIIDSFYERLENYLYIVIFYQIT